MAMKALLYAARTGAQSSIARRPLFFARLDVASENRYNARNHAAAGSVARPAVFCEHFGPMAWHCENDGRPHLAQVAQCIEKPMKRHRLKVMRLMRRQLVIMKSCMASSIMKPRVSLWLLARVLETAWLAMRRKKAS